ncbi:MAG: tRNA (adenosine(37)-N6)-dimethylallyltransferase MiaA [Proteobacteria bacterium]|nr:tRNA (adenosine(37)-N6)-dimethylallyltransferase MiaA [Pseudomonadota bacterium]
MKPEPEKTPVIVIAGPTASGKTGASLALAEALDGEIISADAMAVYRLMDVGTAKPTAGERARVPHHLIDVVRPDEPYDAARFAREAREVAAKILARGKRVFVVGGTGLYIRAFLSGLFSSGRSDPELRDRLRAEAESLGAPALHCRLVERDPAAAARIHENDAFRIVRALEVAELTQRPLSEFHEEHAFSDRPYLPLSFCLAPDREELYARINARTEVMMAAGLVEEVQGLLDMGFSPGLKSMQSIGYRQVVEFLQGQRDLAGTVEAIRQDTRRFAKRQFTWFRKEPGMQWIEPERAGDMEALIRRFLKNPGEAGEGQG